MNVTGRIKQIKQPYGGYVNPNNFEITLIDDGITLNPNENVHATLIGLVIDYLTRFMQTGKADEAFKASLYGAERAEKFGIKNAYTVAYKLARVIKGLDGDSITNACKLVTFDTWLRNPAIALTAATHNGVNPDMYTIENIRTMVRRSLMFFEKYGPVTKDGFTFGPPTPNVLALEKMRATKRGVYGGYTPTVDSGDGDFLTADTLWDFKVSKAKPTSTHTLQLLMYYIMGQHSGQHIYKPITKLGIYNPRLNTVYILKVDNIPKEVIEAVEKEVIGYERR